MGAKKIVEAARLTGIDIMQLAGTVGFLCLANLLLPSVGIREMPTIAYVLIGGLGVLVRPRVWLHGPLSLVALFALHRAGFGYIHTFAPWIGLFVLGMACRHHARLAGNDTAGFVGLVALLTACMGVFASLR